MILEKVFGMIWVLMKRVEEHKTIGEEDKREKLWIQGKNVVIQVFVLTKTRENR